MSQFIEIDDELINIECIVSIVRRYTGKFYKIDINLVKNDKSLIFDDIYSRDAFYNKLLDKLSENNIVTKFYNNDIFFSMITNGYTGKE